MIDVHYVVVPAMARRKLPDPVFLLAGGPGQSAIELAPAVHAAVRAAEQPARHRLRRPARHRPLGAAGLRGPGARDARRAGRARPPAQAQRSTARRSCRRCRTSAPERPRLLHDADRGAGSRRRAPRARRRAHQPRVASPTARVPRSSTCGSFRAPCGAWCSTASRRPTWRCRPASRRTASRRSTPCSRPARRSRPARAPTRTCGSAWTRLLGSLPRPVDGRPPAQRQGRRRFDADARHGARGRARRALLAAARGGAAARARRCGARRARGPGRADGAPSSRARPTRLAAGMHFSVVCAEDVPRLGSADRPAGRQISATPVAALYERLCAAWPRGAVPRRVLHAAAERRAGAAAQRRPRPGDAAAPRRARRRGAGAARPPCGRANAGHGVMGIGCMRDVRVPLPRRGRRRAGAWRSTPPAPPPCRGRSRSSRSAPRRRRQRALPRTHGAMIEVRGLAKRFAAPRRRVAGSACACRDGRAPATLATPRLQRSCRRCAT